jgi:hypothetical protein
VPTAATLSLCRGTARRRANIVAPHTDRVAAAGPSWAEDHARRRRERTEARRRTKDATRELTVAVDAGEAGYRRLRRELEDYGSRLEAVRSRLAPGPRRALGHPQPAP